MVIMSPQVKATGDFITIWLLRVAVSFCFALMVYIFNDKMKVIDSLNIKIEEVDNKVDDLIEYRAGNLEKLNAIEKRVDNLEKGKSK